jgi:transposase
MRGDEGQQDVMFSYVKLERRVPAEHPLRAIRAMADMALRELDVHFAGIYARGGRPSIAPERLIRAQLLQVLYSVRSERQLMEQLDYNLLFRWFVGLEMDEAVWDVTVFTKNRERLIGGGIAEQLLLKVVEQARSRQLLSEEHFTVDGTLIQAWANRRSFKERKPWPQATARYPRIDHGRGGAVVQEERCGRLRALLFRPFADREPERVDRRRDGDPGQQDGGGGGGVGVAGWAQT